MVFFHVCKNRVSMVSELLDGRKDEAVLGLHHIYSSLTRLVCTVSRAGYWFPKQPLWIRPTVLRTIVIMINKHYVLWCWWEFNSSSTFFKNRRLFWCNHLCEEEATPRTKILWFLARFLFLSSSSSSVNLFSLLFFFNPRASKNILIAY